MVILSAFGKCGKNLLQLIVQKKPPFVDKLVDQHGGECLGYRTNSIFRLGRLIAAEATLVNQLAIRGNGQAAFRKVVIRKVGEHTI